jgi:hypothetical protein
MSSVMANGLANFDRIMHHPSNFAFQTLPFKQCRSNMTRSKKQVFITALGAQ